MPRRRRCDEHRVRDRLHLGEEAVRRLGRPAQSQADPSGGDGKDKCKKAGHDAFPLVFSTGQVTTEPITLVSLPGVEEMPLTYQVKYDSWNPAVPSSSKHFLGLGWTDNYSDHVVPN